MTASSPSAARAAVDQLEGIAAACRGAAAGEVDGTTIPVPVEDCRLIGSALPHLLAAIKAVDELAEQRDALLAHADYCCRRGCAYDDQQHTDPTDPIRIEELVGILGDVPPPLRKHRTIPCPGTCTCPAGPDAAGIRAALALAAVDVTETAE